MVTITTLRPDSPRTSPPPLRKTYREEPGKRRQNWCQGKSSFFHFLHDRGEINFRTIIRENLFGFASQVLSSLDSPFARPGDGESWFAFVRDRNGLARPE